MIDIRYCILRNTDGYLPFISRMLLDFIIQEYFPLVDGKFFLKQRAILCFLYWLATINGYNLVLKKLKLKRET